MLPLRLDSLWAYMISTSSVLQALILLDQILDMQINPILGMQHQYLMKTLACQFVVHHMMPSRPSQRNPRVMPTIHGILMEVHDQQFSLEQTVVHQAHHQSTRTPCQTHYQASQDHISMSLDEPFAP